MIGNYFVDRPMKMSPVNSARSGKRKARRRSLRTAPEKRPWRRTGVKFQDAECDAQ